MANSLRLGNTMGSSDAQRPIVSPSVSKRSNDSRNKLYMWAAGIGGATLTATTLVLATAGGYFSGEQREKTPDAPAAVKPSEDPALSPIATLTKHEVMKTLEHAPITVDTIEEDTDVIIDEEVVPTIDVPTVYVVAAAPSNAVEAPTPVPEAIQLAEAPAAPNPAEAPKIASTTNLPQRRDLSGLANGSDTGFKRLDPADADVAQAKQKLVEAFPGADVATVLTLLGSKNVIDSPVRIKAVLEHAMERSKGSQGTEDDAKVFDAMLGNAQLFRNPEFEKYATDVIDARIKKGELLGARELLKKLSEKNEMFSDEFVTAGLKKLLAAAEAKKGEALLPVIAQDLVDRGAITPRDAFMAEARDLRDQSADPALKRPANAELALQLSLKMINLANKGASLDAAAAQALLELAKKTAGTKYNRTKDFTTAIGSVESVIATAKQVEVFSKVLESDPKNVRALQGRADLRMAQGDVEGALDDREKSGDELARQTRALRANPKGNECYKCGLEWLKLANGTTEGRKASMVVIANELLQAAKSAKIDKVEDFAVDALDMKLSEVRQLMREHDVTHVKVTPKTTAKQTGSVEARPEWKSIMKDIDVKSAGTAEWSRLSDGSIMVSGGKSPRLTLPFKFPEGMDYDETFQFAFVRMEGKGTLQFAVPLGKGATVVYNGYTNLGGRSGVMKIDGKMVDNNESTVKGSVMPAQKTQAMGELRVVRTGDKASITASLNGNQVVHWQGDISRLAPHDVQTPDEFAIAPYESTFVFTDIRRLSKKTTLQTDAVGTTRVHTLKPVIEAGDMEPTRPKYVPKEATWSKETGSWYLMLPARMSFAEANRVANASSASIVVVDSPEENEIIRKLGRGQNQWLGIGKSMRDGKLYQVNGEPATYFNWGNNEGTNPKENLVQMSGGDGTWADYPEDSALVCLEWKAGK